MGSCIYCSVPMDRIWAESEHAIAFAADESAAEGHMIVVPKAHISSIHALAITAQKDLWALVSRVEGRLRTGLTPEDGFSIGFVDGLTSSQSVHHAVIHLIPRFVGDGVDLPQCDEWLDDYRCMARRRVPVPE